MISDRRTLTYIAIALIVGAALALAVALARNGTTAVTSASQGQAGLAAQSGLLGSDQGASGIAIADPAKTEAMLDQFVAKDPFIPLVTQGGSTPAPTPSPTSSPTTSYSAGISVNGTKYTVVNGDKVPSSSPAFKIAGITSGDVTFTVIDTTLENGDTSITVNLGESVRATLKSGKTYDLSVLSIGQSGSGTSTSGHSISVLSITSSNGTAMATIEVDGKTYADLKVGDTVTTSWGQISIISINVSGQTVTVMHGDATIVLHAGQVVVK
jgi:hypothetical protein